MLELLFQVDSFLLDDNEIESEESNEDPEDCLDEDEDCLDEDVNTDDDDEEESEDLEVKTVMVQFHSLKAGLFFVHFAKNSRPKKLKILAFGQKNNGFFAKNSRL